ncbi:latent-transforming growth factor beta-binding protein 3-like isoform X2 [Argiope bruennichi]|nr:latent-transforming growth factor beta-binding protein 3-like isoform X2 [Argiope bruennichi]
MSAVFQTCRMDEEPCDNKEDICGKDSRVRCVFNLTKEEPLCECKDFENLIYDKILKKCISECEWNEDYCGENSGATCRYDEEKEQLVCDCGHETLVYDKEKKKCESNATENINTCQNEQCENGGTCVTKDGENYKCQCLEGYGGKRCESDELCEVYKEKICGNASCKYDNVTGSCYCYCKKGFYFDAREKTCKSLDPCMRKQINGECNRNHEICSSGECQCEVGYRYSTDRNACIPDNCVSKYGRPRCTKNMECKEKEGKYSCHCMEGFYRMNKECVKYDYCTPGESRCPQDCRDGKCICFQGFKIGDEGEKCVPGGEVELCDMDCDPGVCMKSRGVEKCVCPRISHVVANGTCTDKCRAGYIKSDECPDGCITDDIYGYKCECAGRFKYAKDGVHCENKGMCEEPFAKEDCFERNGLCEDNFDLIYGYDCKCRDGYEKDYFGTCIHKCRKLSDYCTVRQSSCALYADDIACSCLPLLAKGLDGACHEIARYSYIGDFRTPKTWHGNTEKGFDVLGEIPNYGKLHKEFDLAMESIFDGYRNSTLLKCINEQEYWKCSFEIKLDWDPQEKINLISTPSVCLPLQDGIHCLLPPNFVIEKISEDIFHETNPCDEDIKSTFCGEETECHIVEPPRLGYQCRCKKGFHVRTTMRPAYNITIELCEDINECMDPEICPNTTQCMNLYGSYKCICEDGHRLVEGKSPKVYGCKEICRPNPCLHGSCVVTVKNGFFCNCEGKYSGRFCNETKEIDVRPPKNEVKIWAITAGIAVGTILVSAVSCFFLHRRCSKNNEDQTHLH